MTTVSRPADRALAATALSGITSKLQKILLAEVLVFLGNSAAAVALIVATYGMATQDHFTGSTLVSGYLASGIPAALFAVAAALTACVAVRTWKMLAAAGGGDVAALSGLSSPGWAVIAPDIRLVDVLAVGYRPTDDPAAEVEHEPGRLQLPRVGG